MPRHLRPQVLNSRHDKNDATSHRNHLQQTLAERQKNKIFKDNFKKRLSVSNKHEPVVDSWGMTTPGPGIPRRGALASCGITTPGGPGTARRDVLASCGITTPGGANPGTWYTVTKSTVYNNTLAAISAAFLKSGINIIYLILCFTDCILGEPGLAGPIQRFSSNNCSGMSDTGFFQPDVLLVTQPTVSKGN